MNGSLYMSPDGHKIGLPVDNIILRSQNRGFAS